jgi:thymidylate synthase
MSRPVIIVAMTPDGGISLEGKIPWKCPADVQHFKNMTVDHCVLMGRKTWASLPVRPLPNRRNVVLSRHPIEEVTTVAMYNREALDKLLKECDERKQTLFIIGGKEIYEKTVEIYPQCELLLTLITDDTLFPEHPKCDLFLWPWLAKRAQYLVHASNYIRPDVPQNIDYTKYNPRLEKGYTFDRSKSGISAYLIHGTYEEESPERQVQDLIYRIAKDGDPRVDRTGVGTLSLFGAQIDIDISERFPLMTVRKTFFKGIFEELMWFLRGIPDSKILEDKKINVWKGNSSREYQAKYNLDLVEGDCGPHYPHQWRHWGAPYPKITPEQRLVESVEERRKTSNVGELGGIDQVANVIHLLKTDPASRRMIISGWNVSDIKQMGLPPCHCFYQFGVHKSKLNVHFFQRSSDTVLALHWNISSAALFVYLLGSIVGIPPGRVIMSISDAHIYNNHIQHVNKILSRRPYKYPRLEIVNKREKIEDYQFSDVKLLEYMSYPSIDLPMNA